MCPVNQRCEIANDRDCPDGVVNKDLCPAKARCVNCSNTGNLISDTHLVQYCFSLVTTYHVERQIMQRKMITP